MMRATGEIRKIQPLGRIVLPVGLRQTMDIKVNDTMEIYYENGNIIVSKYTPKCLFCGNKDDVYEYKDMYFCKSCIIELKEEFVL